MRQLARAQRGAPQATMPVVSTSTLVHARPTPDAASSAERAGSGLDGLSERVYGISQTPQVWLDHQVSEYGGALVFNWDAVQDLFPWGMLDDMFAAYGRLLRRLAGEEKAWQEPARQLKPPTPARAAARPAPSAPARPRLSADKVAELLKKVEQLSGSEAQAMLDELKSAPE